MNRTVAVVRGLRAGLVVGPGLVILAAAAGLEAGLVVVRFPEYAAVGESARRLVVEQAAGWLLLVSAVFLSWSDGGSSRGPGPAVVASARFVADWNRFTIRRRR